MKTVFVDTSYWIALLYPLDPLHERAGTISRTQGTMKYVTTEMILAEMLNYFSAKHRKLQSAAGEFVQDILEQENVTVEQQSRGLFLQALDKYRRFADKHWSLTDCASFAIMEERGLTEALTHDRHFEQGGFTALLRDE